MKKTIDICSCF